MSSLLFRKSRARRGLGVLGLGEYMADDPVSEDSAESADSEFAGVCGVCGNPVRYAESSRCPTCGAAGEVVEAASDPDGDGDDDSGVTDADDFPLVGVPCAVCHNPVRSRHARCRQCGSAGPHLFPASHMTGGPLSARVSDARLPLLSESVAGFDPALHPRDRRGEFRDVLGRLSKDAGELRTRSGGWVPEPGQIVRQKGSVHSFKVVGEWRGGYRLEHTPTGTTHVASLSELSPAGHGMEVHVSHRPLSGSVFQKGERVRDDQGRMGTVLSKPLGGDRTGVERTGVEPEYHVLWDEGKTDNYVKHSSLRYGPSEMIERRAKIEKLQARAEKPAKATVLSPVSRPTTLGPKVVPNEWQAQHGYAARLKPGVNVEHMIYHYLVGHPPLNKYPPGSRGYEQFAYTGTGGKKADREALARKISQAFDARDRGEWLDYDRLLSEACEMRAIVGPLDLEEGIVVDWDPVKHPRGRGGRFEDVLMHLRLNGHHNLGHGVTIEKGVLGVRVAHEGHQPRGFVDEEAAVRHAVALHSEMARRETGKHFLMRYSPGERVERSAELAPGEPIALHSPHAMGVAAHALSQAGSKFEADHVARTGEIRHDNLTDAQLGTVERALSDAGHHTSASFVHRELEKRGGRDGLYRSAAPNLFGGESRNELKAKHSVAVSDWKSGRAYLGNDGNYRLKAGGRVAPWNASVKRDFPTRSPGSSKNDLGTDAFHRLASEVNPTARAGRVSKAQALVDSGLASDMEDARAQLRDMGEPNGMLSPGGERKTYRATILRSGVPGRSEPYARVHGHWSENSPGGMPMGHNFGKEFAPGTTGTAEYVRGSHGGLWHFTPDGRQSPGGERIMGSDAAVAVGRFKAGGPEGYRAATWPGAKVRTKRETAVNDERLWLNYRHQDFSTGELPPQKHFKYLTDDHVRQLTDRVIPQQQGAVHDQSVPGEYRMALAAEANRRGQRRYGESSGETALWSKQSPGGERATGWSARSDEELRADHARLTQRRDELSALAQRTGNQSSRDSRNVAAGNVNMSLMRIEREMSDRGMERPDRLWYQPAASDDAAHVGRLRAEVRSAQAQGHAGKTLVYDATTGEATIHPDPSHMESPGSGRVALRIPSGELGRNFDARRARAARPNATSSNVLFR